MKIVLKHILRNIWERKGRSLLIIGALIIATTVFILNLILPNEILLKVEETFKTVYGDSDINLYTYQPFNIDDINKKDDEISYTGYTSAEVSIGDIQALVFGVDIDKAKEFKLLGSDVNSLGENEIIINKSESEKFSYKEGDILKVKVEDKEFDLKIVKIVSKKGIMALDQDYPHFVSNLETVSNMTGADIDKFESIFINVKDDDKVKEYYEYLKENNEDYIVDNLVDLDALKSQLSFVNGLMILVFLLATLMIFFVTSSLNKIIVAERMPVIGTFRSVGATKHKMNFILVLENAVYGLIGGIIGTILAYLVNSKVATLFVMTEGVELSSETANLSFGMILVGILFAVLLEIFISIKAILKANKKPIKDIIFDVQTSRYNIKKRKVIIGIILIILSLVLNILNTKSKLIITMICLVFLILGISNVVSLIMRLTSKLFTCVFKKLNMATAVIASKNIGYNKMIISSSKLIVVSLSLILSILSISASFTSMLESFKYTVEGSDILIEAPTKSYEEYQSFKELDEITDVNYIFAVYDDTTTYNGKKFKKAAATFVGEAESKRYFNSPTKEIKDLEYDEVLVDEKFAELNQIKLNDELKVNFGRLNKEITVKVAGFLNATYFSTNRNVIVMNLDNFKENLTDIPLQVHLTVKKGVDLEKTVKVVEKQLKEVGVKVVTIDEYLETQKQSVESVMGLFYVVIGLALFLSFIGIINNQVIGFIQRKKEIAVLKSTCMSAPQLRKMLLLETVLANLVACFIALIVGLLSVSMMDSFLEGLMVYVDMIYDWNVALTFVGIIFVVLLLTLISPIRRLKKMNIVDEIKYE